MEDRRRWMETIGVGVLALVLSGAAVAQSDVDEEGIRLSLHEALRFALENNLELEAARVAPEIAEQQILVQEGGFDGTFSASAQYDDNRSTQTITTLNPQDSVDDMGNPIVIPAGTQTPGFDDSETISGVLGWRDPMKFGGTYTVEVTPTDFNSTRRTINTAGFFQDSVSDGLRNNLRVAFEMPLLRGLGERATTELLVLARTDHEKSLETLRGEALRIMETVEAAYWDVVANREALRTARVSLERAENLLELNKKKVEVGTLAQIEITQAEASVASQQEGVIVADVNLRNSEDELRRLMGFARNAPAWSMAIVAVDRPSFTEQNIDLEEAIEVAMNKRPDVVNARLELSKTDLSQQVSRRNAWHELNVRAEYVRPMFDSDQGFEFPTAPTQNNKTNTDGTGDNWQVALTYSLPVRNRTRKANRQIAALNRSRADIDLLNVEQNLRVEVRTAVRNVDSGYKRVEAARKNVELQKQKLEAEQKKFENGMSTSFEVLTFQNDLADAELGLIRAGLDYAKALTSVERSKGTLLEARGLTIEEE